MGPITTWAVASSAGLALMTGLYLNKRDDYASAIESCNSDKLASIAEAERVTRETLEAASARKFAELERQAASATRARDIAEDAVREASSRPERVRTVIREVAASDSCINTRVPDAIRDSLRD